MAEDLPGLEAEARVQQGGDSRGGVSDGKVTAARSQAAEGDLTFRSILGVTAKANKRVQFGYGLNYLIDVEHAVTVDVEPTAPCTYDEIDLQRSCLTEPSVA